MKLYIRIKDGKPFEHPILEDNFRQAFPTIDVNNLPSEFMRFERIPQPKLDVYQVYEGVTYEIGNHLVRDKHLVREMTDVEKLAKQNVVKEEWAIYGAKSWVFDEITCSFKPPIPCPEDGKYYKWNEKDLSWDEITILQEEVANA